MKVWIYVWKACRNHNSIFPSNSDYLLVDIEAHFGYVDEFMKLGEDKWDSYAENWADTVDYSGSQHGYEYGWEEKQPPQEWLEEKIKKEEKKIDRIKTNIESIKSYIK